MKYIGMPMGMWALFSGSFRRQLKVLGYDGDAARSITRQAKPKYRQIIRELPEFEKGDRFQMNAVNCAMLGAFLPNFLKKARVSSPPLFFPRTLPVSAKKSVTSSMPEPTGFTLT